MLLANQQPSKTGSGNEKKIHNSVYEKYEVFFKSVIGRRPISKDSAVPYRQGTENSVSKQVGKGQIPTVRKLRN